MFTTAPTPYWWQAQGLGDAQTTAQGVSIGAAAAGSALPAAVAAGLISSAAVPFVGAAIAGAAILANYLIKNSGCGPTCVQTSSWANQAEPLLRQNIEAYFSQPAPRSQSSQALALQTFDQIWQRLQELCGQTGTGDAGVRCITDRQAGACTWHQRADSVPTKWAGPQEGECWNWWNGYRDPIAQDTDVVPDSQLAASEVGSVAQALTGSLGVSSPFGLPLLIAAAVFVVWAVAK